MAAGEKARPFTDEQFSTATDIARSLSTGLKNVEPSVRMMGLALYIAADIVSHSSGEDEAIAKFEAVSGMAASQIREMMRGPTGEG